MPAQLTRHETGSAENGRPGGRWLNASDLKSGDRLLLSDGGEAVVEGCDLREMESKTAESVHARTYNIAVDRYNTYFAGLHGIFVHNMRADRFRFPRQPNPNLRRIEGNHLQVEYSMEDREAWIYILKINPKDNYRHLFAALRQLEDEALARLTPVVSDEPLCIWFDLSPGSDVRLSVIPPKHLEVIRIWLIRQGYEPAILNRANSIFERFVLSQDFDVDPPTRGGERTA
jgi:hypothetical protein